MSSDDSDPIDELYDEVVDQTEGRAGLAARLLERHLGYKQGAEDGGISIRQIGIFNRVTIDNSKNTSIEESGDRGTEEDYTEEDDTEPEDSSPVDSDTRRGFMGRLGRWGAGAAALGAGAGAGYAVIDGMEYDITISDDDDIESFIDGTLYSENGNLSSAVSDISQNYNEDGNYKIVMENGVLDNEIGLVEEGDLIVSNNLTENAYRQAKKEANKY